MGTSNGLNHFNVNALKSCGLNFSENTQKLKREGTENTQSWRNLFLLPFCVPVSVIVAETEACQKWFKMPTATLRARQSPRRALNQAQWAEGEGLQLKSTGDPTGPVLSTSQSGYCAPDTL